MMSKKIEITLTTQKKDKPDYNKLGFGRYFTDHMFVMDYHTDKGWYDPRIVPYEPISLSPSSMVFHYGQAVFEGMKAYRTEKGQVLLFRPDKNLSRLNTSNERLDIPAVDEAFVIDAIKKLITVDKEWVPTAEGQSLYIRPFIIATEPYLGVRPSSEYKLIVILSPVGSYYGDQLKPVKIYVEDDYVRSVKGGVGFTKTSGNYAASLKAQTEAEKVGYAQVLWLDGVEKKYVEEVGSMNIFFKIDGEVVTPALNGSILAGVTRDSVINLLKHWGVPVSEKKIAIEDIYEASKAGKLEEVFGTGTAAVISPVGELKWEDHVMNVNNGEIGPISQKLYDAITGIQSGKIKDEFGWTTDVEELATIK
ncbi:branched-chain amino acid aminotransferase [Terrilactibacillus sp. BCM23-1]|uniref:Branched-chain-amino-acid aminotransferase n=2 Tax=Terrilactibacillus tamarindi TaxID=2599694 RepID=A0A6N8CP77_9BACI|nr:branched-chain amino acid aminotransferase [Terrilactibacillus tamarindi]MTT30913.1 branched-chain amino acid aminotransferase [Terrilactibacillus tamarindi]